MSEDAFARRVTKLGALADPVRRRLYRFVAEQPGAVSRDQAAEGVEVARHTAKFHLDKLVDEGLLTTEFRRMSGRSGPGAGRPAKLYRRSRREVAVSLPERRYDLAGQVLAEAAERALEGTPMTEALGLAATDAAGAMVEAVAPRGEGIEAVAEVLDRLGYEPAGSRELELRNCPYARLAADHTDLVCRVNESFVSALVGHLDCGAGVTRREGGPAKGGCCVRVGH
ncbi:MULTISPECIES: helix-turn-helix transcriptional regulator [Nocardioides]|uniref:Helix-turn-helix transcriptional regulator n=1 Tax=Nocardioides vastitatis TaxID=2568655 RepID=A0ABW0ZPM5_9ACTN|nr:helix-turn-helix domain-containing protein [Nocardioides sp.]THJ00292.1 transcriptional regulator [Nocardioides sp.]